MSSDSLSMLLYCVSVLDRIVFANAMGLRIELSSDVSLGQPIPTLTSNNHTPRPIPSVSVFRYSGSFSS